MISDAVPHWRVLLFVAQQHLTPLKLALLATGLVTAFAFPLHLISARTFTLTVSVLDMDTAFRTPIAAIQVFRGACLLMEAVPSAAGSATVMLPPGEYTVSARTSSDGRLAGWLMLPRAVHLDRDRSVALNHELVLVSDLDVGPAAPAGHCPAR